MIRRVVAGLLAVAATGCAREEPPPGTEVDNSPPQLLSTRPQDGEVVEDLDHPLVLDFDEPVDERNGLQRQLRASPAYRYRVEFGFSDVEIRPRGGWRKGVVYVIHVPPPFTDLVGNRTDGPIEVAFSTGPPVTGTRVEGTVIDRVEGRPARRSRVLFYSVDGDTVPYTAVQDTGETFALRSLPPGRYRAYGFRDLNANMRLEQHLEAHDSTTFELDGPEAAATLELAIVEPDSTAPVLASASARDSQLLELRFDDPLDPEQDFGRARVAVRDTVTEREVPVAAVGLTPGQVGRAGVGGRSPPAGPGGEGRPAAGDTTPPDGARPSAPGDMVGPARDPAGAGGAAAGTPPDTVAPAGAPSAGDTTRAPSAGEARADTSPLPSRTALVRLSGTLTEGTVYRVRADGFRNLRHLSGGGDTLFVYTPPADTARARPDTAGSRPDTAGVPPDTSGVPSDTARARPDTAPTPPSPPPGAAARPGRIRRVPAPRGRGSRAPGGAG